MSAPLLILAALWIATRARRPTFQSVKLVEFDPGADAGVPIYAGWPMGWRERAVNVSKYTEPGELEGQSPGYGPRPDRFDTWQPMRSGMSAEQYAKQWQREYTFGVIEAPGAQLDFYALTDGLTRGCCSSAERSTFEADMGAFGGEAHGEHEAVGMSGPPPAGAGWRCAETPFPCYRTLPRPATGHPTIADAGWTRPSYPKATIAL